MVNNGSDIQIDKGGFVRIHYAILEQLAAGDFSSREYACILHLLRMTYGFNRKACELSYNDFANSTGIDRTAAIKTLRGLVARNIVVKVEGDAYHAATWSFNKYFEQWQTSVKTTTSQIDTTPSVETTTSLVVKTTTSYISAKDNIKDNSKDTTTTLDAGASVEVPLVEKFENALREMNATKNKVPHLIAIYRMCFGKTNEPTGGELAGAAKAVGSASLLAKDIFDLVSRPPVGPVLPYIIATENGRKKRASQNGGNREIVEVKFAQGEVSYE